MFAKLVTSTSLAFVLGLLSDDFQDEFQIQDEVDEFEVQDEFQVFEIVCLFEIADGRDARHSK